MMRPPRFLLLPTIVIVGAALPLVGPAGCQQEQPQQHRPVYDSPGKRAVPPFMRDTIYETTNLQNDNPFLVSAWGLVVNLEGTGGSEQVPNNVKAYMMKEMEKNGFGSTLLPGYAKITPELVLHDKNAAVVAVYGWIPPGARKGQQFDISLRAEGLEVTSLARGQLFAADLTYDGANAVRPKPPVNVFARARGPVFVNPAVVLDTSEAPSAAARRVLRTGWVIGGGRTTQDRPLLLRLREPQRRLSRAIEHRVNEFFHQDKICTAYDEGYCQLWVPESFNGDWAHFSKLVLHLYLKSGSEAVARAKARDLVAEAMKPAAPLQDISYCWEGLGTYALPALAPLLAESPTDVRFAAARAAAYIGDPSGAAERALFEIARTNRSPFQLAAVQVLGRVPNSPAVNHLLRQLLDSDESSVRVEAYNILAANADPSVQTQTIATADGSAQPKFHLDIVHSTAQPLIYATRSGEPRIAIFGDVPDLKLPITFAAMSNRLMISSGSVGRNVTLFYRDAQLQQPVQMSSNPDLVELLARLAGQVDDGTGQLNFNYSEILAIVQGLSDQRKLSVMRPTGEEVAAAFLLQEPPQLRDAIDNAPVLDRGRPQGDNQAPRLDNPAGLGAAGDATPIDGRSAQSVDTAAVVGRQ